MQTSVLESASRGLARHLVGVSDAGWALWKWAGLRSAGFPASDILKLAAPAELGAAADQVEAALDAVDAVFKKALQQINLMLDNLKKSGDWEDSQRRLPLLKTKRKLEAKQPPGHAPEVD